MLCGFGSLTSIGIYLGALVSAVPQRRNDFADLSLRGLIYGNIACLMTTCIAGKRIYARFHVEVSTRISIRNPKFYIVPYDETDLLI